MILINDLDLSKLVEVKKSTQAEVIRRTGIGRKTMWTYFNNRNCHHIDGHGISTDRLYKILNALDMRLVIMDRTEYERLKRNEDK